MSAHDTSTPIHPFIAHPLWPTLAALPWGQRLAQLRDPAVRAQLLTPAGADGASAHDSRMAYLTQSWHKMYALVPAGQTEPDYEPPPEHSVAAIAQREGRSPMEVVYDLDTEALQHCEAIGLGLVRAATAGTHPAFVSMIRELILERTEGAPRRALGERGARADVCPEDCCPGPPAGPPRR